MTPGTPPPTDVPQPLKTFTEPIVLTNPGRERIRTTYILTVDKGQSTDAFDIHNAQRSATNELVSLLEKG